MHMNLNQSLTQLGLTKNETDIYLHLLKKGGYSGAEVYKQLNLDKSSFYRALNRLQVLKLVRIEGEKRNQKFFPEPISNLIELQKQKLSEIEDVGKNLINLTKELEVYASRSFLKNNIQIFEGENAFYDFMDEKLKGKVETIHDLSMNISDLYPFAGSKKKYEVYIADHIKRRVAKGIKIELLLDNTIKPTVLQYTDEAKLKEVRQYMGKLNTGCFLNVFGDRVGFMTERAGGFWGIIIKDKLIADLMSALFGAIWQNSKIIFKK